MMGFEGIINSKPLYGFAAQSASRVADTYFQNKSSVWNSEPELRLTAYSFYFSTKCKNNYCCKMLVIAAMLQITCLLTIFLQQRNTLLLTRVLAIGV